MKTQKLNKQFFTCVYFLGLFSLMTNESIGQGSTEIGFSLGVMQYTGDVGELNLSNPLNPTSRPRPSISIHGGKYLNPAFMVRASLAYGQAGASDSLIKAGSNSFKYERNFTFKTSIIEFGATLEVFPINLFSKYEDNSILRPYLLVGLGSFYFNPKGLYNGLYTTGGKAEWVDLYPLKTSGQGLVIDGNANFPAPSPYKKLTTNIHFGFGVRYQLSKWFDIGLELMNRRTNTNYLDDIGGGYNINFDDFDNAFDEETADKAKYLSNYPMYKSKYISETGDAPGGAFKYNAPRRLGAGNDYYYTTSFKIIYFFNDSRGKYLKKGVVPNPPAKNFF